MAEALKILGQTNPSATSLTDCYAVPSGKMATVSTIIVANRSATPTTFRISVAQAGAANNNKQYIYYDLNILGNDTFASTIGISLGALDVVRVYANDATLSFGIFGVEL